MPTKLEWMNGQYLSALPATDLLEPVRRQLAIMGVPVTGDLLPLIDAVKTRSRTSTAHRRAGRGAAGRDHGLCGMTRRVSSWRSSATGSPPICGWPPTC